MLTPSQLKIAALADSHTFARLRGRVQELHQEGRLREAVALQDDYNERLGRWIELITNVREGEKELR